MPCMHVFIMLPCIKITIDLEREPFYVIVGTERDGNIRVRVFEFEYSSIRVFEYSSSSIVIGNGVNHSVALVNLSQPQRSISLHKMSEWQSTNVTNLDSPHATFTKVHRAGFILLQIQLWGHNCRGKRSFLAKDLGQKGQGKGGSAYELQLLESSARRDDLLPKSMKVKPLVRNWIR